MTHPPQVRLEEPIAVTPHDGICGGESQQWLSYPTNRAPGKRRVESLSQTGEAGRGASGSTVLPEGESLKGQEHGGEAGVRANMPDPTPRKTRAIGSRMDCLNPSHQRWTSTSRATACKGAVQRMLAPDLPTSPGALQTMQGPPRALIRRAIEVDANEPIRLGRQPINRADQVRQHTPNSGRAFTQPAGY